MSVNLSSYTNFKTAVESLGSTYETLVFDRDDSIYIDMTVPANITIDWLRPFKLTITNAVVIWNCHHVQSNITWQIFKTTGTGKLTGCSNILFTYPEMWGLDANNNQISINKALEVSHIVTLLSKEYIIDGEITFPQVSSGTGGDKRPVMLCGQGESTIIKAFNGYNGAVIRSGAGAGTGEYWFNTVKNLTVDMTDGGDNTIGIWKKSCRWFEIDNVQITGKNGTSNHQTGFLSENGTHGRYYNLKLNLLFTCLRMINNNSESKDANDQLFSGLWLNAANSIKGATCIKSEGLPQVESAKSVGTTIIHPYFESLNSNVICIDVGYDGALWTIIGGHFDGQPVKYIDSKNPHKILWFGGVFEVFTDNSSSKISNGEEMLSVSKNVTEIVERFGIKNTAGNFFYKADINGFRFGENGGLFKSILKAQKTDLNLTINNNARQSTVITVTGARQGDIVSVGYSNPVAGILMTGNVTADDTVTVDFFNQSGNNITYTGGTLTVYVMDEA